MKSALTARERFIKACRREPVDRPPVWMMRQAGRYLPEYLEIRKTKSTLEMMKDPETACKITLQPVERLGVDAAILYSDILIVPEAMGQKLDFVKEVGPVFEHPIRKEEDLFTLNPKLVTERSSFVPKAIRLIREKIGKDFPLLGFAGAPFTVGAYMVGGDGSHDGNKIKKLAYENLKLFRRLMEKLTQATIEYLRAQVEAGVDALQLFDTWAGTLSSEEYVALELPYVRDIFSEIRRWKIPSILYIKGGGPLFDKMVEAGPDVISIDWRLSLSEARRLSQDKVALQGNLDPAKLYGTPSQVTDAVEKMVDDWGTGPGYIVNLGHGIMPDVPVENAAAFINAAKKFGSRTV
jgi:uroporphyrinogen decarboxylase